MNWIELQYLVDALGWTLVHFLWQGAVLGVVFLVARGLVSRAGSIVRYRTSLAIFLASGVVPVFTFVYLWQGGGTAVTTSLGTMAVNAVASSGGSDPWWLLLEQALRPYLPWLVAGWLAGVSLMSGRVCMDWWQVRRLTRQGVSPLPDEWERRVRSLIAAFGVSRPVRVLRSGIVRVPAVIGWLRPVILVPSAALTGLSPRQLELVIAHELAHIRRADYLVNLLQVVIETLLFYHPVVAWMSNELRAEREHCCDDAVVETCGDTLTYAHALAELEAQRQNSYQTALAASGGHLSQRIYRLLDRQAPRRGALVWSLGLVVSMAAASVAVATQVAANRVMPAEPQAVSAPALATLAVPEPTPVRQSGPESAAGSTPAATSEASADGPAMADDGGTREVTQPAPEPAPEPVASDGRAGDAGAATARLAEPSPASRVRQDAAPGGADDAGAESRAVLERLNQPRDAGIRVAAARPDERPEPAELDEPVIRGGNPLATQPPEYPRRARLRGLQGNVTAQFTIDRSGRVTDIRIVDATPAGVFDRAVEKALSNWRFEPLYRDGERMQRRVSKVFAFNLDGGAGAQESADSCDPMTGTRICRPWSDSELVGGMETFGQQP